MSFSTIINKYRTLSFSKADQGNRFERLMKAYIQTAPVFRGSLIKDVWLWSEFPSRKDFGSGHDTGIDLVVKTENGDYWAVQCKCYSHDAEISKKDVDTFLSTSSRSFYDTDEYGKTVCFSRRLWIDTTVRGFSTNAEDALKNQNPPVNRIGLYTLANDDVDWDKLDDGLFGEKAGKPKYEPKPYQQIAIDKVHEHFKEHDRGKLIMACGTGKTYCSLKIAENETRDKVGTILFLAPSIALVGQTLKEWCAQAKNPIHGICVCSDPTVSKKVQDNDDSTNDSIIDLALPASTSYSVIENQIRVARNAQKKDNGLVVVFSTYQSIAVVREVQKRFSDGLVFDLCICDEAHRTTGVTLKGEDESEFVKIHDKNFIKANRRLYMTATPRLYRPEHKQKAAQNGADLCSMDDEDLYGQEIHRLGFGEAVKMGLLSDYKVLVLTLNEDEMSSSLQQELANEDSEIPMDDSLKLIGCINALSKITKETALLEEVDPGMMHNAIAFCQNIKISKKTVSMLDLCRDAYYRTLTQEERTRIVSVKADHVDGSMGAAERAHKLAWLRDVDRESNQCNVLMNVRCLSEGVDVPSLDAILFLSARNSEVDVVQSVGRVMRKFVGKRYGYIIIPVVIPSGMAADEALDDNKRFAVVWQILRALRAHDDRFDAKVQKLDLNKRKPAQILIGGVISPSTEDQKASDIEGKTEEAVYKQLEMKFEEVQNAVYAKLVEKCGDRRYWEQWAEDIAKIAERHIIQIKKIISEEGSQPQKAFEKYIKGLRKNINPSVTEEDAVEMLAQHFITQPVFEALFQNYSFVQNNPISKAMQGMVKILHEQTPKEDNETLDRFYESVRDRARDIDNAEAKQRVIVELYDKFFKKAFPKTVEKLGIVYTPVEVVDFIINSVEDVMKKEFGRSISDENVHVLDPFTGTGTFIVRLLQSGIIKPEDMARKYANELHACEIVLLAYYIASINIENTYHDYLAEQNNAVMNDPDTFTVGNTTYDLAIAENVDKYANLEYKPFNGIVLTDTFQLGEDDRLPMEEVFPQNFKRAENLKKTPITVIISNPPYSVGQRTGNDNAQNEHYENLENRISDTYAKQSIATLRNSLYDSYIKAFRWSTDRIGDNNGVIGFVTNAGWLDGNAMDGMRKCFEEEFSSIYVFNLRGNQRTSGELSRKEGGKIFGSGSRTPIAITILVKKKEHKGKAKIRYNAVDDYLTREDKLELCKKYHSVLDKSFKTIELTPDEHGDWLSKRNDHFETFIPLGGRDSANGQSFFEKVHSNGLKTQRDAWCYNFSADALSNNIERTIDFYNSERERYQKNSQDKKVEDFVISDPSCISWTRALRRDLSKNVVINFDGLKIREALYRPFTKQQLYCDEYLNEERGIQKKCFANSQLENIAIGMNGVGSMKPFSPLITNIVPDLELDSKTQIFPMYWYAETIPEQGDLFSDGKPQYIRHDAITDFILSQAKDKYGDKVTKEDIFYYVYGILHQKSYAEIYASDLKKMLPRLPLVTEPMKFWAFSKAGRALAELHINYESVPAYPDVNVSGDNGDYVVKKMRFPEKGKKDSIIFNDSIVISNIPDKAYAYIVNGKSAIEWIMERYAITTDKASGIINNPNDWAQEHGKPRYILDLLLSVINVSCQTVDIVNNLPEVDWDKE